MKNISTAQPEPHSRFRSALIVAGIVTAIICSLVSMKDIRYAENEGAKGLGTPDKSVFANVDLVVNAAYVVGALGDRIY